MDFGDWALFVTAVLVLGGGLLWYRNDEEKQAKRISAEAGARGWTYRRRAASAPSWLTRATFFFRSGGMVDAVHALSGVHRGYEFEAYEERSRMHGNGSIDSHDYLTVHFSIPENPGTVEIREQPPPGVVPAVLGFLFDWEKAPEITFENRSFSDRFRVRSDNEEYARLALTDELQNWLVADGRAPDWPVVLHPRYLQTKSERKMDVAEVASRLDFLADILDRLPDSVRGVGGQR